jgi:hypothetical protein
MSDKIVQSGDEGNNELVADPMTTSISISESSPSLEYEIVELGASLTLEAQLRPLSIEDIHDNFLVSLPLTAKLQSKKQQSC